MFQVHIFLKLNLSVLVHETVSLIGKNPIIGSKGVFLNLQHHLLLAASECVQKIFRRSKNSADSLETLFNDKFR